MATNPKETVIKAFELAKRKTAFTAQIFTLNQFSQSRSKGIFIVSLPNYQIEFYDSENRKIFQRTVIGEDLYSYIPTLGYEKF